MFCEKQIKQVLKILTDPLPFIKIL